MNIRDLQYLVALAETKHFGQAALACHVSQPTLSAQLKKLEDELGVMLFERSNKAVRLTPVGERLVAESRQVLQGVQRIKQVAASHKDPFAGPFHLGIIPTLGPYLLPHILCAMQAKFPALKFVVYEHKTEDVLQALRAGKLDAVILALPVRLDGLIQYKLFDEPFYVLLPAEHPLAQQKTITQQAIARETLLLLEEGHCLREQALEACDATSEQGSGAYRATSLETLRHIVSLGAGITLLPALAVHASSQLPGVVVRPLAGHVPARTVGMLWRQTAVNQVCCQALAELIHEQTSSLPELKTMGQIQRMVKPLT